MTGPHLNVTKYCPLFLPPWGRGDRPDLQTVTSSLSYFLWPLVWLVCVSCCHGYRQVTCLGPLPPSHPCLVSVPQQPIESRITSATSAASNGKRRYITEALSKQSLSCLYAFFSIYHWSGYLLGEWPETGGGQRMAFWERITSELYVKLSLISSEIEYTWNGRLSPVASRDKSSVPVEACKCRLMIFKAFLFYIGLSNHTVSMLIVWLL